ncbi:hypothetical protein ABPG74_000341 [Tetrahymena malaccensis]
MEHINSNESDILKIIIRFLSMNNPSCNVIQDLIKKMHNNRMDEEELEKELNLLEHNMREHKESIKIEVQNIKNKNGKQLETSNFFKQSRIPCSNPRLRKVSKNQNFTACFNSKNDAIKGIEYIKQNYTYDIIGFTEKSKSYIEKEDMNKNQFSQFIEKIIQNTFKVDAKSNQMEEQLINSKRKQEQLNSQQPSTGDEKEQVCLPLKKLKKENSDEQLQEINTDNTQIEDVQNMLTCSVVNKKEQENNQNELPQNELSEYNLNLQNQQNCEKNQENFLENVKIDQQNEENNLQNQQKQENCEKNEEKCEHNCDIQEKYEQNQENSELNEEKSELTQELKSPQYSQQIEEQDDDEEEEEVQVFSQSNQNLTNSEQIQIQIENENLQKDQVQKIDQPQEVCAENQTNLQQEKDQEKQMNQADSCQELNSNLNMKVLDTSNLKEFQVEVLNVQDLSQGNQNKDEKLHQKTDLKCLQQSTNQHQQPKQSKTESQNKTDIKKSKSDKQVNNKDQIKESHSQKHNSEKSSSNHHDKKKDTHKSNNKDSHQKSSSKSNVSQPEKQKSINKDKEQKKHNQSKSQKKSKKH